MSSFMLAVSVVMTMMIYMIVGGIIRKLQIISPDNFKEMNTMVFKIFIPLALFFDIYESNLGDAIQGKIFLFIFCGIMTFYIGSWFVFTKWIKDMRDAATMIQNAYRSNYVLFGAMLADSLGGNTARAQVAGLAAMVVPLINMLSVILFEVKTGQNIKLWPIIKSILKNPLVDAGILGIFMNLTGLKLPVLFAKPLCILGDMATPLALVVLGGMLSAKSMMSHKRYLTVAVFSRSFCLYLPCPEWN